MAKSNLAITGESARSPLATRLDLSQEKLELVRTQIAPGAPDDVIELYFERCRVMGFDPFAKMLHLTPRNAKENGAWVKRWTFVTSIDGFRSIAEDSGEYDGQEKPIHEYDDNGRLLETTVTVYRKGMTRGVAASAPWAEYVQTDNDGVPTSMWRKMPKTMLAKCAEALALRKAFPKKLASVYTTDEMAQADNHSPAMQANAPRRDAIDAEFSPAPAALADSGPVAAPAPSRTEEVKAKVNRANVERLEAQQRAEALLEEMKADPALATPAPAPFKRDERFDDVAKVLAKINKIDSEVSKTHIMRMALGPTFDPKGGFSDSDVAAMIASAEELLGQMVSQLAKMEADSRTIPDGLFDDIPAPNSDEVRYCTDHDCGAVLAPAAIRENHIPGCRAAETLDGRL